MALGRDCFMLELAMREPVQMGLLVSACEKCHENRLERMLIAHANITRSCALRYTGCMETGRLGINRHDFRIETDDGLRRTNTIVLASVYCPRQDTAAARIRSVTAANVRHPRRSLKETNQKPKKLPDRTAPHSRICLRSRSRLRSPRRCHGPLCYQHSCAVSLKTKSIPSLFP